MSEMEGDNDQVEQVEQVEQTEQNENVETKDNTKEVKKKNKKSIFGAMKHEDRYKKQVEKLKHREEVMKQREEQRIEEQVAKCTFAPKTIKYENKEKQVIYEKENKVYQYGVEQHSKLLNLEDKNSLCETLFSGRIRTTNVILPDYGQPDVLSKKNAVEYMERQKKLREEKLLIQKKEETKPGSGNYFDKKVSRVTVPTRTCLFSEQAYSLRDMKNSIKSVKKPIAPHKFSIGYENKSNRKNLYRLSKNIMLTSDEADKNIMNLNAQNHRDLINLEDGISYEDAIVTLKRELKKLKI